MSTVKRIKRISTIQVELTLKEATLLTWLAEQSYAGLEQFYEGMCNAIGDSLETVLRDLPSDAIKTSQWNEVLDTVTRACDSH